MHSQKSEVPQIYKQTLRIIIFQSRFSAYCFISAWKNYWTKGLHFHPSTATFKYLLDANSKDYMGTKDNICLKALLRAYNFVTKRITRSENIVWNENTIRSKTGKTVISSLLSTRHFQRVLIYNKSETMFKSMLLITFVLLMN